MWRPFAESNVRDSILITITTDSNVRDSQIVCDSLSLTVLARDPWLFETLTEEWQFDEQIEIYIEKDKLIKTKIQIELKIERREK